MDWVIGQPSRWNSVTEYEIENKYNENGTKLTGLSFV